MYIPMTCIPRVPLNTFIGFIPKVFLLMNFISSHHMYIKRKEHKLLNSLNIICKITNIIDRRSSLFEKHSLMRKGISTSYHRNL